MMNAWDEKLFVLALLAVPILVNWIIKYLKWGSTSVAVTTRKRLGLNWEFINNLVIFILRIGNCKL
jgi:hypothetical protein